MFKGNHFYVIYYNYELEQDFILNHLQKLFDEKRKKIKEYLIITINNNTYIYIKLDKIYHVMNIKFFDVDKYHLVISVSKVKTYILYYIKSCKHITNINFNKNIST